MWNQTMRRIATVGLAVLLVACGGGGGANNSGAAPAAPSATSQSSVVSGTITGFGSVYVNGVHFDTRGATFSKDNAPAVQSDLRVGQVVKLRGRVDSNGTSGSAESVSQNDNVEGPISGIDAANSKFVVLGQTVLVDGDTSFDDSISPASLQGLKVNDQVEVSGMVAANGDILATRVELRRPGQTQLEVVGKVSAHDAAAKKFNINALVVNYASAQLDGFTGGQPNNGDLVEAKGNVLNAAGELVATKVEIENNEPRNADRNDKREIEGLITRYVSATDFDVAGRKVTTNAQTIYEGGTASDLKLDARVEVEGPLDAAGVLVAVKVKFRLGGNARIEARVDSVDRAAKKLVVLGIEVTLNDTTRIEDKSDARIEMFSIDNIASGDYLRVRGLETAPLKLTASRLERRRPESDVRVRGTARDIAAPKLTVLGVQVETNASTRFERDDASITADEFFRTAAGRVVSAKGTVNGTVLIAREVEFEDED
jgi:hypothetical protein